MNQCLTDEFAHSPLIIASQNGHLQCVYALLAAGADPHYTNHYGQTALYAAEHNKHLQIVALLKAKIAELDRSA